MENILVVLTSFLASDKNQPPPVPQNQNQVIQKWFWRSCFSRRYATGGAKATDLDIKEIINLKNNQISNLGEFEYSITEDYFLKNCLNMSAIATKTFILLLAQENPLDFIQGTKISLEKVLSIGNRKEFHHIYPKSYLEKINQRYTKEKINCLANFTILSRTDNNTIKNRPPSKYRTLMPNDSQELEQILKTHLCTMSMFNDDYDVFLESRTKLLLERAEKLCL